MNPQLTEGEREVLEKLLDQKGPMSVSELKDEVHGDEERITSLLSSLSERGLVEFNIVEEVDYALTEEGKEYQKTGLPEVRLTKAVNDLGGKAEFDAALQKADLEERTKGISISWAKRNGWLEITKEDGENLFISLEESPSSPMRDLLENVSSKQPIDEDSQDILQQAIQRTLVEEHITKKFIGKIPSSKRNEAEEAISKQARGISLLTPKMLAEGTWKERPFKPFNIETESAFASYGKKHPYREFNEWLREIFLGLGFTEWFGPYVETEFWNNDALFVPQDHVAREVQDQFRITEPYDHGDILDEEYFKAVKSEHEGKGVTGSEGWDSLFSREVSTRLCLRSHTTPVSMRYLWEHREPPQKMFIVDRNFRAEKLSAKHAQEFNQCDGIIMDEGLTLRDLMGFIEEICHRVGIEKVKFKPGQFPFTEPSIEGFAKHEELGWIEVAPGGIFRPEVTRPLGIEEPVLAWGIGSGRLYMAAMGISDIRQLYSRDLEWLRRNVYVR
ncbi:MAG: phenylalanine--tRNA ligase subunit alpha [Candidatus Lokiarchaeota archaeon]|nr:phenylalanine--tRNA ligase subunit alpha [Candidatus Lokiarchaeota archaeon]